MTATEHISWAEGQHGTMFKYWYSVLRFQMTTLMLVRSFRESNLLLLISCLKEAVPLCFALNHIHYSRWLSVFIQDLLVLCYCFTGWFLDVWALLLYQCSNVC